LVAGNQFADMLQIAICREKMDHGFEFGDVDRVRRWRFRLD
jgi:hypothetical protein